MSVFRHTTATSCVCVCVCDTLQRTLEIWTFAIQFAFKYALLGQKWTYGKEGMTPVRVLHVVLYRCLCILCPAEYVSWRERVQLPTSQPAKPSQ